MANTTWAMCNGSSSHVHCEGWLLHPTPIELNVKRKINGTLDAPFRVFDLRGNLLLTVDESLWFFQMKRILCDPTGFPILTMRKKALTLHHRWTVHRGESSEASNLLFTVQLSRALQIKPELDVFLASNSDKHVADFCVIGCYSSNSFKVLRGNTVVAEAADDFKLRNFFRGQDNFRMRVYPGVDYTFVVAFLVILYEMDSL